MEIEDLTLADLKFAHPTIIDADIGSKKEILKVFFLAKSSRYRYCTVQSNPFLEGAIGRILRRAALPHWTDCSAQLWSLTILTMKEKSQKMLFFSTMQITGDNPETSPSNKQQPAFSSEFFRPKFARFYWGAEIYGKVLWSIQFALRCHSSCLLLCSKSKLTHPSPAVPQWAQRPCVTHLASVARTGFGFSSQRRQGGRAGAAVSVNPFKVPTCCTHQINKNLFLTSTQKF